jgi:hypothetical protein
VPAGSVDVHIFSLYRFDIVVIKMIVTGGYYVGLRFRNLIAHCLIKRISQNANACGRCYQKAGMTQPLDFHS